MQVIEAPNSYPERSDLFLAGGISNCPDWQSTMAGLLAHCPGYAINPRRSGHLTGDIAEEQIKWEYDALRAVDTVMFWFPEETLCPITLFELGVFTQRTQTRLVVGTHPNYARRLDVITQLSLARPEVNVQNSLEGLAQQYTASLLFH